MKIQENIEQAIITLIHYSWIGFLAVGAYLGKSLVGWLTRTFALGISADFQKAVRVILMEASRPIIKQMRDMKHEIKNNKAAHLGHYEELKEEYRRITKELSELKNEKRE